MRIYAKIVNRILLLVMYQTHLLQTSGLNLIKLTTFSREVCIFFANKQDFCYKSVNNPYKIWFFNLKYLFLQKNYENQVFKL